MLPQNIFQVIMKPIPINREIVKSCTMKKGIPFWVWRKVNGNQDNNMLKILDEKPKQNQSKFM